MKYRNNISKPAGLTSMADYWLYSNILQRYSFQGRRTRFMTTYHSLSRIIGKRDSTTLLDYRGARFSDPHVGGFISIDPMAGMRPGLSPYNYCSGNPILRVDPTGMLDRDFPPANSKELSWQDEDGFFTRNSADEDWTYYDTEYKYKGLYARSEGGIAARSLYMSGTSASSGGVLSAIDDAIDIADAVNAPVEFIPGTAAWGTTKTPFSPRYYGNNWGGNQYTNTFSISKAGKGIGTGLAIAGTLVDIKGVHNYYTYPQNANIPDNIHRVSPSKFGLNATMTLYGFMINPIPAAFYSGIDNFYPGGWPGAANTLQKSVDANRAIYPNYHPFSPKL